MLPKRLFSILIYILLFITAIGLASFAITNYKSSLHTFTTTLLFLLLLVAALYLCYIGLKGLIKKTQFSQEPATFRNVIMILGVICVILLAISLIISLLIHQAANSYTKNDAFSKQILGQELSKLPQPPTCVLTSRTYGGGTSNEGLGSNWDAEYNCKTTLQQANQEIYNALHQQFSFNSDGSSFSTLDQAYRITNNTFNVDYYFYIPNTNGSTIENITSSTEISGLSVTVSRSN